jgi:hypothetical protein
VFHVEATGIHAVEFSAWSEHMSPNSPRQGRRDTTLGTAVTKAEKATVIRALLREGATDPGPMIREILFAYRDVPEVREMVKQYRLSHIDRPSVREQVEGALGGIAA